MSEIRNRLTHQPERMAGRNLQADSATPETPIDLGKNRPYHKIDEYHTFEPSLNHWEPDMRHEWKEDKHDETGFGIPKMAKVYMAAKKATKLAMAFLGENASEDVLEMQARAFMRMGNKALTASLDRWAACHCEDGECDETPAVAAEEAPAVPVTEEAPVAPEVPAEAPAEAPAAPAEEATAPAEAPAEAPADVPAAPAEEAAPAPAEEEIDVDVADDLTDTEGIDFDTDVPDGADTSADDEIAACFADEEEEDVPPAAPATTASKKSGIKTLAGQPTLVRVASNKTADDLTNLWDKWN